MNVESKIAQDVEFCKTVLRKAAISNAERVARGLERRQKMWTDFGVDKNRVKGTYRYEFMVSGAKKVLNLLRDLALSFNVQHSDDMVSQRDLLDILTVATERVKGKP